MFVVNISKELIVNSDDIENKNYLLRQGKETDYTELQRYACRVTVIIIFWNILIYLSSEKQAIRSHAAVES